MKPLKTIGVAAVALIALVALIGAGTASATVFCRNNSSTSSCSETYGIGTEIEAANEGITTLTTSFKNIECSESTVAGKVTNAGGSSTAVSGSVETLTFGACNCEVKVLKNGTLSVTQISGTDNGTLSSSGAELTASCSTIFGNVHCIYTTSSTDLGTLTGGNPARLDIADANLPRVSTNTLCAEKANWDATYKVTNPTPLYVVNTEEEIAAVEAVGAKTQTVGTTKTVKVVNERDTAVTVGMDSVTDATVLEKTGVSCAGNLAATATCETRGLKCLKAGTATWSVIVNPGNVRLAITVKCDP